MHPPVVPCLGSDKNSKTDCISMSNEDYNKLILFQQGEVSSLIEDIIQYITMGLISPTSIEVYLSFLRDEPEGYEFNNYTTFPNV